MHHHAIATHHWRGISHRVGLLFASVLLLTLASMPRAAQADCWFRSGSAATVTFNAGNITLTPSTQLNSILWTSNTASPPNPPVLSCDGNTNGGIFNSIAASVPVNGDNTLFPTGIPGISYRLLHPDITVLLALYPDYRTGSGTFNVTSNLQLVYTGPFLPPSNSSLNGQLAQWKIDICNNPYIFFGTYYGCSGNVAARPIETFKISATITVLVPTCNIDAGSANKTVSLSPVSAQQLTGVGSTAVPTAFNLKLTSCPTGLRVFVTLDSANPLPGATGVIAPTAGPGYATGVGVQILKADGTTPVTFSSTPGSIPAADINTGTTTGTNYLINLYARYYQTSASVSAGNVKGVATYTVNYQ